MAAAAIGLQAGLSQTDWFGLGTGLIGTGMAAAAYNQAAYLSSVAMRQCQMYQKKNYDLAWVSVARDDIRDMMNISVTRISNYMMVATLILGIACDALLGINFPSTCPDFIESSFWISMAFSIFFFTESIMFAVKGQNSAFLNTMRLLTWELRPENPAVYDHDYMKQWNFFEHSSLAQLFRLPGLSPNFGDDAVGKHGSGLQGKRKGCDDDSGHQQHRRGFAHLRDRVANFFGCDTGAGSSDDQHRAPEVPALEEVQPRTRMLLYLARFGHFMQLWQPYDTASKYCIGLGLICLAHGAAYFSLGQMSSSGLYMAKYIGVIAVAIFVVVTTLVYQQNFHTKHIMSKIAAFALISSGPGMATLGVLLAWRSWAAVLVPLCHGLNFSIGWCMSMVEFKKPWQVTKKFTTGPRGQEFPEDWSQFCQPKPELGVSAGGDDGEDGEDGEANVEAFGAAMPSPEERRKVVETSNRVLGTVRRSILFAALVWFTTSVCAAFVVFETLGLWLASTPPFGESVSLLEGDSIDINAPALDFQAVSLACRQGMMFAANKFQVFKINITSGDVSAHPCELSNQISGLTLSCDDAGGLCRPLVLLDDQSTLVDCASGMSSSLLQSLQAEAVAVAEGSPGVAGSRLIALNNGTNAECRWQSAVGGWAPQWALRPAEPPPTIIDIDATSSLIFSFFDDVHDPGTGWAYRNGVTVRKAADLSELGSWRLRDNEYKTMAACAMNDRDVFFLQSGDQTRLWHSQLPI